MIKNNYHTHIVYCNHAVGNVEDYVKQAIELKFEEIGITDHAPVLERFMSEEEYKENWCDQNMKIDTVPVYLNDIAIARQKYGDKIHILSGFESEFLMEQFTFYQELKAKVDYLNLGVHYYKYKDKIYNTYSEVNYKSLVGYVETAILGMESGLFNTLVHPDLFMYAYKDENGERKFDIYCERATRKICEAAIQNNVYLEVNAGGLVEKGVILSDNRTWPYPVIDFWKIARKYPNLKIIIGADAHHPNHLANENVDAVCKFSEELNLKICQKMNVLH